MVSKPNISERLCLSCENLQSEEVGGYANWEESCLVKFSEFLGFQTIGYVKELINTLRQLKDKKVYVKVWGSWVLLSVIKK